MKNYRMFLMGGKHVTMTAEDAANIAKAWNAQAINIIFDGEVFATHQICSIERAKGQELKDICGRLGIETKDAPRIEQFLSPNKLIK